MSSPKYDFSVNPDIAAMQNELANICERVINESQVQIEKLTHAQMVEAFRQAVLCGDFQRNVVVSTGAQTVIYLPYNQEMIFRNAVNLRDSFIKEMGLQTVFEDYKNT